MNENKQQGAGVIHVGITGFVSAGFRVTHGVVFLVKNLVQGQHPVVAISNGSQDKPSGGFLYGVWAFSTGSHVKHLVAILQLLKGFDVDSQGFWFWLSLFERTRQDTGPLVVGWVGKCLLSMDTVADYLGG